MCIKGVLEVLDDQGIDDPGLESKVLDFAAGGGQMGDMLAEQGFTEIYGQEGSQSKLLKLRQKEEIYKDVHQFIVGK